MGSVKINNCSYNVSCYADDIFITSTTVPGLQKLINVASQYISRHGLSFNPTKTQVIVFGKCTLAQWPEWHLNGTNLQDYSHNGIKYLGTTLSQNTKDHIETRIKACRRAYYAMQGAGLHCGGLSPNTIAHVWSTALQPILNLWYAVLATNKIITEGS